MLNRVAAVLAAAGAVLLVWNLYTILMIVPDEKSQGIVYRLLYFHVPAWWTAFLAVGISAVCSALYLGTKRLIYDALAAASTEVAVVFLVMGMVLGSIWG